MAAIIVAMLLAVVPVAAARPGAGGATSVRDILLKAGTAKVSRAHGSVYLSLTGTRDINVTTFRRTHVVGTKDIEPDALRRIWTTRLGLQPVLEVAGRDGRATLYSLNGPPTWSAAKRTLTFSANATPANARAARAAEKVGGRIRARILPTRAHLIARRRPPISARQTTTPPVCTTVQPARANTSFCLSYQPSLGAGNTSWVNLLSGTMQPTQTCQTTPSVSPVSGNSLVQGSIQVYQNAAAAQQALSVSAQIRYSQGLVSAEAKASFSKSSSTSTNAVYAIAQVNLVNGTVNLGRPTLTSDAIDQAAGIADFSGALRFLQRCGDSVPVSYTVGASWMAVLQLNTRSQSDAQSLYASIGGSIAGIGAAASFSKSVESSSYTVSVDESDYCAGPPSCTSVSGYTDPATAGGDVDQAMSIFSNNYSLMLTNLAGLCAPTSTSAACINQVNYQPIYTLLTSGSSTSPSVLVNHAASAAYTAQSNFNSWATGYQALMTANPYSWSYWDWETALDDLNAGGMSCDLTGMTSDSCAPQLELCSNQILFSLSAQSSDCLPSAFNVDNLLGLTNPYSIDPTA